MTEYIAQFDEFLSRCDAHESEHVILSRFRVRLHDDLKRELLVRDVDTLHRAYQVVQDLDYDLRPLVRGFDQATKPLTAQKATNVALASTGSRPAFRALATTEEQGKAIVSTDANIRCFRCQEKEHKAN